MKHLFYCLTVCSLSHTALGQRPAAPGPAHANLLSLNVPAGKPTNLRPQYERIISRRVSLGARGAWYFGGDWPGWQAEVFGRYYFRPTAPAGFYGQAQVARFHHRGQLASFHPGSGPPELWTSYSPTSFSGSGAGLGVGYQWLPGRQRRLVLDGLIGLKVYAQPNLGLCDCGYEGDWYERGPGGAFNGRLGVGFAF